MDVARGRHRWLLFVILIVALVVRLATVRFGLPALNDPDELMFEMGAVRMLSGPTLNPGWFGHPATTTIYLLAVIDVAVFAFGYLTGRFASPSAFIAAVYHDPGWVLLPGRIVMVLFGLATIWLTYRLTARFCGARAGLAAALLLAFNPVHVTWSQIVRSDMMACVFMLLCLQACCAVAERGRWRDYVLAALWLGVSIATKWPFAIAALAIAAASWHAVKAGVLDRRTAMIRVMTAGPLTIAFLLAVSPYLLIAYPTVLQNLQGEGQAHHLGATGGGLGANLLWYLRGPFIAGFTVPGLLLLVWGALGFPRRQGARAIVMPVAAGFLLLLSLQHLIWERWALPLMPLGAMLAGCGLVRLDDALRDAISPTTRRVLVAVLLGTIVGMLGYRAWSDGRMRMNDTRQLASRWAAQHVAPGSTVLIEHFAFDILDQPWRFIFPMADAGCVDVTAMLRGKIDYATIERARRGRSNVDYGTVPAARRGTCRTDVAILTQMDRYQQERAVFPVEAAAYRELATQGRVVATFKPVPGRSGGPVVTVIAVRR